MTTLLSFSLLVALGRGQAVSTTLIPAVIDGEAWAVPATVGGKEGLFLVLLQQEATRVSSAWLAGRPGEVRLAGQPAGRAKAVADFKGPKVGGKPIVGTLGLDAFRGRAVGFDVLAKSLSVWDRISPEAASAWVGAGAVRAPLRTESGLGATVEGTLRGKSVRLRLKSSSRGFGLLKDHSAAADPRQPGAAVAYLDDGQAAPTETRATAALRVGEWNLPWSVYDLESHLEPGLDGEIPLLPLSTGRAVVDLAGGLLAVSSEPTDAWLARALSSYLWFDVRIEGDEAFMAKAPEAEELSQMAPFVGRSVATVAGIRTAELLASLRGPDRAAAFAKLEAARREGFSILVRIENDQPQVAKFNYPPDDSK